MWYKAVEKFVHEQIFYQDSLAEDRLEINFLSLSQNPFLKTVSKIFFFLIIMKQSLSAPKMDSFVRGWTRHCCSRLACSTLGLTSFASGLREPWSWETKTGQHRGITSGYFQWAKIPPCRSQLSFCAPFCSSEERLCRKVRHCPWEMPENMNLKKNDDKEKKAPSPWC